MFTYMDKHLVIVSLSHMDSMQDLPKLKGNLQGSLVFMGDTKEEALESIINSIKLRETICSDVNLKEMKDNEIYLLIDYLRKIIKDIKEKETNTV